jgi:tetratricopeptide (TPR) repeat protein
MFKHLFISMNEMLNEVADQYPQAVGVQKRELDDKLLTLKSMSDTLIEEWLRFEEKLAAFYGQLPTSLSTSQVDLELDDKRSEGFVRGQGYYKLQMYAEAIREFTAIVRLQPDFTLARLYLAMSFLQKGEVPESYSHFYFLSQITENRYIKAISCTAMGCIQMQGANADKGIEYFNQAYQSDPGSVKLLLDMGLCHEKKGQLDFFRQARK